MFFAPSKTKLRAKIQHIGMSKTSDHIQIKIKMSNPSQDPLASSKVPNGDSKYENLKYPAKPQFRFYKKLMCFAPSKLRERVNIWNMGESKTIDHIQIKIKILNPRY